MSAAALATKVSFDRRPCVGQVAKTLTITLVRWRAIQRRSRFLAFRCCAVSFLRRRLIAARAQRQREGCAALALEGWTPPPHGQAPTPHPYKTPPKNQEERKIPRDQHAQYPAHTHPISPRDLYVCSPQTAR